MSHKNKITRRQFFKETAFIVAGSVVTTGVLSSFKPNPAAAAIVPEKWDKEAM